jgi:hypothetical protein
MKVQNESIALATATAEFTATRTTSTTTTSRALFARAGDVDGQGAAIQLRAVQGGNGFLRFLIVAHGHETKAAGAIGHAIHHQIGFHDCAVFGKRVIQVVFCGIEGKIPYE